MRKSAATLIAAAFAFAAAAQQPQQCVNPELLNGLVFLGRAEMKVTVTRGQAAFMSGLEVPAGLTLIGSGVREAGLTHVAYRSSLSPEKAYAAIMDVLGADGWAPESSMGPAATFNVADGPREASLCRDGVRRGVQVAQIGGQSYVSILAFSEARQNPCNVDLMMSGGFMPGRGVAPQFQFPQGTTLAFGGGGGGGSNTLYTSTSRIISPETPAALVRHLASQIEQQGWQPDADWSAGASAGSTWRKSLEGTPAWGTLEIIRVSEGTYDVDFTIALPQ